MSTTHVTLDVTHTRCHRCGTDTTLNHSKGRAAVWVTIGPSHTVRTVPTRRHDDVTVWDCPACDTTQETP